MIRRDVQREKAREAKKRYWKKTYDVAPTVQCACGCGELIKNVDEYARPRMYKNGHNTKKYEDPLQAKREWNHRNREKRQIYKSQYRRTRKVRMVLYFGGKCLDCGVKYDGNNACIFHFHHLQPKLKSFAVGAQLVNRAWARLVLEAKKCDLLCGNCHSMRHGAGF